MDDREYKKFEEALNVTKLAPQVDQSTLTLRMLLESIEEQHQAVHEQHRILGEMIERLRQRVNEQATIMLELYRTTNP